MADDPTPEQDAIVAKARQASLETARARRGASIVEAYKLGDKVRVIDAKYAKADMRGNLMKQGPRWSEELYTVSKAEGRPGLMPTYFLEETGKQRYTHDQLQRVKAVETAEQYKDVTAKERDLVEDKTDGNKVWNRGFVLPQRRGAQYGLRSGRKLPKASAIPKRSKARYKMRRRKPT